MNLDIPPGGKVFKDYNECLDLSAENFRYYVENRDKEDTEILNVLQAGFDSRTQEWYDVVKEFKFDGWSIGGVQGSKISSMMYAIAILLQGKEHLQPHNKWLHILGTAKISDFLILEQLQKSLKEVGSNVQVTTDSSSPDYAVVFGGYYLNYNFKKASFQSINVPKHDDTFENQTFKYLPVSTEFDKEYLRDALHWDDTIEWKSQCTTAIRLHNFMVFKEAIDKAEYYVYAHDYMLEQIVSTDMFTLLKSLDTMVKSDNPKNVFEKHKQLYTKMSRLNKETRVKNHDFF